ncbi:ATP-binding cassette domain-containing protein [Idiomarina seosinensis]|uniref:amino acid ABC transporter ATP-binding/permease protein n=1 Tax=Idiomarina seosinensis TaxID=281739 RepID=UPI00384B3D8F
MPQSHWQRDWRRLAPWLKQLSHYRLQLFIGIGFALATALFAIGLLSLSGWFITAAALYVGFDIYTPGAGIRFFAIARTVSRYLERVLNHDLVLKLQARWRVALFRHMQTMPLQRSLHFRVADAVQQLTRNLDSMDNLLLRLTMPLMVYSLATLALALFWWLYNPLASSALLLFALLILGLTLQSAQRGRRLAVASLLHQQRARRQAMNLTESMAELLAWDQFDHHSGALMEQTERLEQFELNYTRLQQKRQLLVESLAQLVVLITLFLVFSDFQQQRIGAAEVIMLALSALAWQELATELSTQWANYGKTVAAARSLLSDKPAPPITKSEQPETKEADIGPVTLQLRQLSVSRQQRTLIKNLTATFKPGYLHWIEGPSGVGKSTLAEALIGAYPEHHISGAIQTEPPVRLSAISAYLTQQTEIFSASIKENLNPARRQMGKKIYWQVLDVVGLTATVKQLPQQLDTAIGPRGVQLSGGQLRRIALARTLLQNKPVMVLDEPFAGVERQLMLSIIMRMIEVYPDRTWIIISHVSPLQLPALAAHLGEVVKLQ